MSSVPRLPSVAADLPADFGSVTAHAAELITRFFELYGELWQHGVVDDPLRELTRIRNARITDCGY